MPAPGTRAGAAAAGCRGGGGGEGGSAHRWWKSSPPLTKDMTRHSESPVCHAHTHNKHARTHARTHAVTRPASVTRKHAPTARLQAPPVRGVDGRAPAPAPAGPGPAGGGGWGGEGAGDLEGVVEGDDEGVVDDLEHAPLRLGVLHLPRPPPG